MIQIDRKKLEDYVRDKGMNLSQLAEKSGVSRQSIYNMFNGQSIFLRSFEKIISTLGIDYKDLLSDSTRLDSIIEKAPYKIKKIILKLKEYALLHNAELFLIGSRARGKESLRGDWDFAIKFHKVTRPKDFSIFKQNLLDQSFPYSIDIVCLNDAPDWFIKSIADDALVIH